MHIVEFFALNPESYSQAIQLFVRLLGVIYLVAYFPFFFQVRGLIGKNGIRPINAYLNFVKQRLGPKRYYYLPTLFWFNASDLALYSLIGSGCFFATLLIFGIGIPYILIILYIIHLSLNIAGQEFLSFGWETFLMEITVASFLTIATTPYNIIGWISMNLLLMRFFVQAGASKLLSGDANWRNLTAIWYHYLTQPLPNTLAWYFHKFPLKFHKISTGAMFFIELVVPFFIFSPGEIRLVVFCLFVLLQLFIYITGNFSYLNHMTIIFCLILLNNQFLNSVVNFESQSVPSSLIWQIFISLLAGLFLTIQFICFINMFYSNRYFRKWLSAAAPLHVACSHGIFAIMTTQRFEIIIQGSYDGHDWKEYQFRHKPGNLALRPKRISPYQPRLDWQAWFLPFHEFEDVGWFQSFLKKLLEHSPEVIHLLKFNPFPDSPPKFVRALIYDYQFTTYQERKETKNWWKRQLVGEYASVYLTNKS